MTKTLEQRERETSGKRTMRVLIRIRDRQGVGWDYQLDPLSVDREVVTAAWRFTKLNDAGRVVVDDVGRPLAYCVSAGPDGVACECLGFLRWGFCKHRDATLALLGGLAPARRPAACHEEAKR